MHVHFLYTLLGGNVENKKKFVKGFCSLLKECGFSEIASMRYEASEYYGEFVVITYTTKSDFLGVRLSNRRVVDVTADNITAMCRDITRAID